MPLYNMSTTIHLSFAFIYSYLYVVERLGEICANWLYQSKGDLKLLCLKHGTLTTNRLSFLRNMRFWYSAVDTLFLNFR